jgi:hypothetical protein
LKKSTQTQAQTSTSEPSTDLSAIDEELSSHINSLNDVIKSIATNLKSV